MLSTRWWSIRTCTHLLQELQNCNSLLNNHQQENVQSVSQFSRSVVSNSLQPHEPQHVRPPCPSPTPGVHPNPCHRVGGAIQPSPPLLSPSPPALTYFPASRSFPMSHLFASGDQSIEVSASTSVPPINI